MKKYIFLAVGGSLGSILRFSLKTSIGSFLEFPLNTLIINSVGCLLLGIVLTALYEFLALDSSYRIGIATGFLGAFTTFSTVCKELYFLLLSKNMEVFFAYFLSTILLGLLLMFIGVFCTRKAFFYLHKIKKQQAIERNDEELQ